MNRTVDSARRVLVVEDDALIGLALVADLASLGYQIKGPVPSVAAALSAIESFKPDAAVLDVNLRNRETTAPIAHKLHELGLPFVFLTGYGSASVPELAAFSGVPRLSKPVSSQQIQHFLDSALPSVDPSPKA